LLGAGVMFMTGALDDLIARTPADGLVAGVVCRCRSCGAA